MPLSYHGFGPAAILIMIVSVIVGELIKVYRHRKQQH
jgi:hypothetical protein